MSHSEFDSSDEECSGLLKKALDVKLSEKFDPCKQPTTGEEYLQQVIYERKRTKPYVTVPFDRNLFLGRQTLKIEIDKLPSIPDEYRMSKDTQTDILNQFDSYRKFIEWWRCQEEVINTPEPRFKAADFRDYFRENSPNIEHICNYSQPVLLRILNVLNEEFVDSWKHTNIFVWLYAVLGLLDVPPIDECYSSLRQLCRLCLVERSNLAEDNLAKHLNSLNVFICLISRFFRQLDLADPYSSIN